MEENFKTRTNLSKMDLLKADIPKKEQVTYKDLVSYLLVHNPG